MIKGIKIVLRPIKDEDWPIIEQWGSDQDALRGAFQCFQLDHVPQLHQAYQQPELLTRASGLLLAETLQDQEIVGYVQYSQIPYPDADMPYPEIGFGVPQANAQGKGYAKEACKVLSRVHLCRLSRGAHHCLYRTRECPCSTRHGKHRVSTRRNMASFNFP